VDNPQSSAGFRLRTDLAAVLLAGGQSSRMGRDKALLRIGGQPLIHLLAKRLLEVAEQVFVSAPDPAMYAFLSLPCVRDVYAGCGPLAGLHAAMLQSERPLMLVLACDLPRVSASLLQILIDAASDYDVVIPETSDGRLHPVCAVYRRTCLAAAERCLQSGEYRMLHLFEDRNLRVLRLRPRDFHFPDSVLSDMNSPRDWDNFLKQVGAEMPSNSNE
jgi:molybdopterin-guanine dinucleotide biosynthesis protein A